MPEEIWLLLLAAVWLLLWAPAIAVAAFTAPRARDLLRRRESERLSRVVPAAIWFVAILAYFPIFVIAFLSFLDVLRAIFES